MSASERKARLVKPDTRRHTIIERPKLGDEAASPYPSLVSKRSWTKNSAQWRSMAEAPHWVMNILDPDPSTYWLIPASSNIWVIFDLGSPHTLSGIAFLGFDNGQMVKQWQLECGESLTGPWAVVTVGACRAPSAEGHVGETIENDVQQQPDLGATQTFTGWQHTGQFWRLVIKSNHGSFTTCLHQVQFFGLGTVPRAVRLCLCAASACRLMCADVCGTAQS